MRADNRPDALMVDAHARILADARLSLRDFGTDLELA
jgi:hypothetical protein